MSAQPGSPAERGPLLRGLASLENGVLATALALIVIIPLAESGLRSSLHVGISGATTLVQHLTLVVGMIGGAIAAREGRMLALSTADAFLKGRVKTALHIFSHGFAAGIAILLAYAGLQFVGVERDDYLASELATPGTGHAVAYGIPVWLAQAVIPLGFALVGVRSILHMPGGWKAKLGCALVAAAMLLLGAHSPIDPSKLVLPSLIVLGLATLFGAPVFVTLGGAAVILFWSSGEPIASIPADHYRLVTNATLPSIPLFTLAGYFFAEGGASKRLIRVFLALCGGMRGGPAIVTALVCAFFTTFTGASGVTILALAGLLMPILLAANYPERAALGLITGAGSLGLLFPPCLPLILYAIIAKVPMEQMFLGGILPGIFLVVLTAWWGMRAAKAPDPNRARFNLRELRGAVWAAKWELALPLVALVSLFSGYMTPVEASALTAMYAFAVETFVYKDLSLTRGVPKVLVECGLVIGGVLMILGVALGFTNYLIFADFPTQALDWVTRSVSSPLMFLLLLNVFLLVVGCLMDIFSAIVVVVPLIVPMGEAYHIDPVHLGIVFLANLELGYLTPPVGMNLFLASYRLNKPMPEVYRAVIPMLLVLLAGVLVITYMPWMTTFLPQHFGHG